MGVWLALFPTRETLMAQALAGLSALGSYLWSQRERAI